MRKAIILIFAFLLTLTIVNAKSRTTFDTVFNGSFSYNYSAYFGCYGSLVGNGTVLNPWTNNSAFRQVVGARGNAIRISLNASATEDQGGGIDTTYITSGFQSIPITHGVSTDIQLRFVRIATDGSANGGIGLLNSYGSRPCIVVNNGEACIKTKNSAAAELSVETGAGFTIFGRTPIVNELINLTLLYLSDSIVIYENNSKIPSANITGLTQSNILNLTIFAEDANSASHSAVNVTYACAYNETLGAPMTPLSTPDITPPSITYYNLTNEAGCESWTTDKTIACGTSSVVPTIQFNTSESAWCAIGGSSSSSSLDLNYTGLGSSRNCTGAASGEGTTNHFCTLTSPDELVYDTSYLFISCKDLVGNQTLTSTSGPLKLSITGLEAAGRNSVGIGIQESLLSGYTNYTDQQIYARNISNAQVRGTFDMAAKKGNKMWAFNRIGVSDSYVNMFNLTPVLYTLEIANTTSAKITNLTELMINATK